MKERGINIMREILFRGQTRKNGEMVWMNGEKVPGTWVYGGICQGSGDFSIIYGSMDVKLEAPIDKYTVYSDTVGQYTGLTDKNGTKIFEGDVLEFSDRLVEVFWHAFLGQWDCRFIKFTNKENGIENMSTVNWSWKAKVIGNIHDNPELVR